MTILEKAKEKYPDITDVDIKESCPSDYGFEDCSLSFGWSRTKCSMRCPECWGREYEGDSENE